MSARPPRLRRFGYRGLHRYFLTATTKHRRKAFLCDDFAEFAMSELLKCAASGGFADTAHCFMPDHIHLLWTATSEHSAMLPAFNRWRQLTGFRWRHLNRERLWQEGYWDYVLRDHEDSVRVAAYIVANPIRDGLVQDLRCYRWVGSSEYTLEQLTAAIQLRPGRR